MYISLLIVAVLFLVAADIIDVTYTARGLKAGVAVEGFTWLVGKYPTSKALYLRDSILIVSVTLPTILIHLFAGSAGVPWAYGTLVGPVTLGIEHLLAAFEWKHLLKQ